MSTTYLNNNGQARHTDDMQDIITTVPSWILRWGITLFFGILVLIIGLLAFIRYPDVIKTQLKIESSNSPESLITKTSGKLVKLLVMQNETVKAGQPLAWFESTVDHNKYVLTALIGGKISFPTVIHENQLFGMNQEVFYVIPNHEEFFGEMVIPQDNMGKIKEGQRVLIKLKAYPSEEYGMIRGRITYITEIPNKDNVFISKVDFKIKDASDLKKPIRLKQGMMADAEIVTQDATILQRIGRSFFKIIGDK
jgi:hypothetical protein